MKKSFIIKLVAKKVQISSAEQKSNSVLRLLKEDVCFLWDVVAVGNADARKSLVLR